MSRPITGRPPGAARTYMTGRAVVVATTVVRDKHTRPCCRIDGMRKQPTSNSAGRRGRNSSACRARRSAFKEVALRSLFKAGGPDRRLPRLRVRRRALRSQASLIKASPSTISASTPSARNAWRSRSMRSPAGSRCLRAWSAHDVGRAINPAERRGPDPGRLRPGPWLCAVRGDRLGR